MKKFLSVLLAVMMVLSTVSFAVPSAVGTMDAAVEVPVDTLFEEPAEEAVLAADLNEDVNTYGNMIFEINFNNLTSIDSQKINLKDAGWINPEFDYTYGYLTEKATVSFSAWPTYSIKENAGNKYLELAGGTGYAVLLVESGTERGFQGEDGVYTLTADVYRPDAMPLTTRFTASSSEDTPIQDFSALNDAGWGSIILQHDPSCYGNGGHATPMTSASQVKTIKFHRNGGTDDKTVGYDNIRLYYKPLTVDVTVKADGNESVVTVPTTGFSAGKLAEALDLDFYQVAEKVVIGSKEYSANDTVYLTADCEAEVTIGTLPEGTYSNESGLALFDIDFEKHEIGTEIPSSNSDFNVGGYATAAAGGVMSHDPSNWHIESGHGLEGVTVMADPTDASNKVIGITDYTNSGYPAILVTTHSNGASARYGFIEDPDIVYTMEYDYYDTTADGIALRFGGKSSVSENEGFAKWNTLEDTCTESNNGRVASAWYKNYGVYSAANLKRMGGVDEISFIKMHAASPENADLYWDNIKLYYKPTTTTVTVATPAGAEVENAVLENVSTTGVKVSDLLDEAGFEYDDFLYAFKDTVAFGGKTTVHIVLEEKDLTGWLDETKGLLLFDLDFEDAKAAEVITASTGSKDYLLNSFNAKVNPYVEGTDKWALSLSGMNGIGIEDGALKIQWDGKGKWPQILIGISNNSSGLSLMGENGSYYVHAEYKILDSVDSNLASIAVQSNGFKDGVHQGPNGVLPMGNDYYASRNDLVANSWFTIEGGSKSTWTNDTDGLDNDDISKITTVFTYGATTGTPGGVYLMDNIKLYWKPAKANLTVYGGSNANYETVTLKGVPTTSTIDEVIAMLPGSEYGKITGLADMDGNKLTDLGLVTSKSVVAIWTPWVVLEGGQEFPVDEKGCTKTQWSGAYGDTAEVGNGGGDVTGAVSWMWGNGWYSENGNMYRVQDTVAIGENNGSIGTSAEWSTPAVHGHEQNGLIRDQINTNLPAGNDAEYVLIKYRYTNLPDLADVVANDPNPEGKKYSLSANGEELTYYDRNGDTKVFDMSPAYGAKYYIQRQTGSYSYGGGEEFHKDELFVEGEWLYDFLPFLEVMNTDGVKQVLIQRYNLFDQMVTEYDYVRFVKLGEEEEVVLPEIPVEPGAVEAPKSLEENTAMRLEEGKENGIRFQASVTSDTNNDATTIGWVIVSYDNFMAGGTQSYDNLTVETEKSKIGYQRLDGTDLANFFDTSDDEALVMAAVLKGIPEDNYASYILMRPFVKVEDAYYYGEATSTCLYDLAAAIYYDDPDAYDALTEEQQLYVEDVVLYCEDNGLV